MQLDDVKGLNEVHERTVQNMIDENEKTMQFENLEMERKFLLRVEANEKLTRGKFKEATDYMRKVDDRYNSKANKDEIEKLK